MATLEETYPHIAEWVDGWGWIEIGSDGSSSSFIRVLDEGGLIWESKSRYKSLDEAFQALEEALENFAGCAIVVSHDRWFLDRVVTHILAFEGDSQVFWSVGNWSDYETDLRRRLGKQAETPHRIIYRNLTR